MGILSRKSITSELSVKQLTAPAELPISLSEQKLFSRIDGDYEDSLISILIGASTKQAESFMRTGIISRQYQQIEDAGANQNIDISLALGFLLGSEYAIELKACQVSSIDEVIFYDSADNATIINSALYRLDRPDSDSPARVVFDDDTSFWNTRYFTQYKIKFTAGYADASSVPDDIKLALFSMTQKSYEDREKAGGLELFEKTLLLPYRILEL